jgi:Ca2+-binding RTX toxin-like protein
MVKRLSVAVLVATAATVFATGAPAFAGPPGGSVEVGIDGNFDFDGEPGVANVVTVTKIGTTVTLDDVHTVAITGMCSYPVPADDTYVQCTVGVASPDVTIEPGDAGDTVTVVGGGSVNWRIGLGDGSDTADLTGIDDGGTYVVAGTGADTVISSPHGEHIEGGTGSDTISYAAHTAAVTVNLGLGDGGTGAEHDDLEEFEQVVGSAHGDTLTGGPAADTLDGAAGPDTLSGAGGNDTLIGAGGTDQLAGGPGADTASYLGHKAPVTASLDGLANDGAAGENDLIAADVENLTGGLGGDTLYGNSSPNHLRGDPSGNWLSMAGGDDVIYTGGGGDAVYGRGGDDTVYGSWGHDFVYGGYGNDAISGGANEDALFGEQGSDTLHGDGGFDELDGGPQSDWCYGDALGGSRVNCEYPLVIVLP